MRTKTQIQFQPVRKNKPMNDFRGKVVLITGAGLGIGRTLAEAFAAQGAIVVANDLTPINLDKTIHLIQASGGKTLAYVADIASKLALQSMLNEIIDQFGRIDILIQAADVDPSDSIMEMDEWDWRRTLDINLTGPFLLIQSVGRIMREQGGGTMINMITLNEKSLASNASKKGLIALTRSVAAEFRAHNIQINAVIFGKVDGQCNPELSEDPAELVLHLCNPESAGITGQAYSARSE